MATDAPITGNQSRASISGLELAEEGAAMLPILYPDRATRKAAATRLLKRARHLMSLPEVGAQAVGFFLFGLSEAARGSR